MCCLCAFIFPPSFQEGHKRNRGAVGEKKAYLNVFNLVKI